jgi:hypothetical protein
LRHPEQLCSVLDRATSKIPQFDEIGLRCVDFRELGHSVIKLDQSRVVWRIFERVEVKVRSLVFPVVLCRELASSIVDQNATHCLRGGSKEMPS